MQDKIIQIDPLTQVALMNLGVTAREVKDEIVGMGISESVNITCALGGLKFNLESKLTPSNTLYIYVSC